MNTEFEKLLRNAAESLGIHLSELQIKQFYNYYQQLVETNKVMNLTAITEEKEVILKHFVDSLSIVLVIDDIMLKRYTIIDVGTGAGFPGIPIKIAFPNCRVMLMDSLNKRIIFLNQVISNLELNDIQTVHGRAEDLAHQKEYREQYDICVSRAVANLSTLCEYCLPFIHKNGKFISYKSGKLDEELQTSKNAIQILGGKTGEKKKFCLPDSDFNRELLVIDKVKETNKKYPRKAGMPGREPLL